MVLLKWTDGDTITERSANNKGIRKGTEAELAAILTADNELGDVTFNSTSGFVQVQTAGGASDKRGNMAILIGADSSIVTQVGATPLQVKEIDYIKDVNGFSGNQITIIARIKTDNAGTTAHLVVEKNGGPTDELDLTTTSVTYETVSGTIDISADAIGVHTLEFFLYDGAGDTISFQQLEVWGI